MGRIFLEMLKESLLNCQVGNWVELINVSKRYSENRPSYQEVESIAKTTLSGLEYNLSIKEHAGEISQRGDFFLEFPQSNHFMILAGGELLYAAVINIGWRGNPIMPPLEREKYLQFLQDYFRTRV